ncbi:C4-dicarboxylate ABC transporter permease [Falsiroseomonas bella]|uniref:TRAP transporter small permease protein n=2 Tax=Falsiroseomonas bella TaxID=2184016 RepID=A0A317FEK4_9PROT|nr:C4-dicarboxylate ABC transporter permease [Falsiroseomonas bella]
MNVMPLQVTVAATVVAVGVALWAGREQGRGGGPRSAVRRAVLALDRVSTGVASILACIALAVAVSAGAWQVFSRFATETPSPWSEALVRISLIWMCYLGVAVALRAGALVSIDVAHRYSRGAVRRAVEAATLAFVLSFMGVMFWFGWAMTERVQFQTIAGLEFSMAYAYAAIPLGAVFAMVGATAHFLDRRAEELENAV